MSVPKAMPGSVASAGARPSWKHAYVISRAPKNATGKMAYANTRRGHEASASPVRAGSTAAGRGGLGSATSGDMGTLRASRPT